MKSKGILLSLLSWISLNLVQAQTPTNCLEIESILVDACVPGSGCTTLSSPNCSCEGKNEMVRFKVGPNPIVISDITINWPNNSFQGIATPDITTQSLVASLQSSVVSPCGLFVEPQGGTTLPAGADVLLITSTDMCVTANSFANLNTTLYIIFQNPGNFQGHFANQNNSGTSTATPTGASSLRTLSIGLTSSGCSDVVTYDRSLLVNNIGQYGGASSLNDGATVNFDWAGNPEYVNFGCQAPIQTTTIEANGPSTACQGQTISLSSTITGDYDPSSISWTGGTGTFSSPSSTNTDYTVGAGDNGTLQIVVSVMDNCIGSFSDTVEVTINSAGSVSISASGPLQFCSGGSVDLTASQSNNIFWNTGSTSSTVTVNSSGYYTVSFNGACGLVQDSVEVTVFSLPTVTLDPVSPICANASIIFLTANPSGGTFSGTGVNTATGEFDPNTSGSGVFPITYSFTDSNGCTSSDNESIAVLPLPQVDITANPSPCSGTPPFDLTATPTGGNWTGVGITSTSNGTFDPSLVSGSSTIYYSVTQNGCAGIDSLVISVGTGSAPVILASSTILCPGQSATLFTQDGSSVNWSDGSSGSSLSTSTPGIYYAIGNGTCNSDTSNTINLIASFLDASFDANPLIGTAPLTVNFTNTSSGAISYFWDFGGLDSSSLTDPSFLFNEPGNYLITLTASDGFCTDTYSQTILALDTIAIIIPNVFTPNGDNMNDNLLVNTFGIRELTWMIFNRWGQEMFQGNLQISAGGDRLQKIWDGMASNGEAPEGTYFYSIQYRSRHSEEMKTKEGSFALIRKN